MFWTPIFCSRSALLMRLAAALKLATSACVVRRRRCLFFIFLLTWRGANLTWSKTLVSPCASKKFWFLWVPWHAGGTFPPKFLGGRGGRSTPRSPPHVSFRQAVAACGRASTRTSFAALLSRAQQQWLFVEPCVWGSLKVTPLWHDGKPHFKPPAAQGWVYKLYRHEANRLGQREISRSRRQRQSGCAEPPSYTSDPEFLLVTLCCRTARPLVHYPRALNLSSAGAVAEEAESLRVCAHACVRCVSSCVCCQCACTRSETESKTRASVAI